MVTEFCKYDGAAVRYVKVTLGIYPPREPGEPMRRRRIGEKTHLRRVCPACQRRERAEGRPRNSPAAWLSYMKANPIYFRSIFGSVSRSRALRELFSRGAINDRALPRVKAKRPGRKRKDA